MLLPDRRPCAGGPRLPPGRGPVSYERIRPFGAAPCRRRQPSALEGPRARSVVRGDGPGDLPGARRTLPGHGRGGAGAGPRATAARVVLSEGLQERDVLLPAPCLRFRD